MRTEHCQAGNRPNQTIPASAELMPIVCTCRLLDVTGVDSVFDHIPRYASATLEKLISLALVVKEGERAKGKMMCIHVATLVQKIIV